MLRNHCDDRISDDSLIHNRREFIFERDGAVARQEFPEAPPRAHLVRSRYANHRAVLQILRLTGATTRLELARCTGLTKPTISAITGRLIDLDLVRYVGRRRGGRGQPPLQLEMKADGAFGVGVDVDRDCLTLAVVDLAGRVHARTSQTTASASPRNVIRFVEQILPEILQEAEISRQRVVGVGLAVAESLYDSAASGHRSQWADCDIEATLSEVLSLPVVSDNAAAAAAAGEIYHAATTQTPSFFMLSIGCALDGCAVINGVPLHATGARGKTMGSMADESSDRAGARIEDIVSVPALSARLERDGASVEFDLMDENAALLNEWIADAALALAKPVASVAQLLKVDTVLIGARLPLPAIERLAEALSDRLAALKAGPVVRASPALNAVDSSAIGAATLPFVDQLLLRDTLIVEPAWAQRPRPRRARRSP
jgi:predicted NBD/HSP70 family sugar kinase